MFYYFPVIVVGFGTLVFFYVLDILWWKPQKIRKTIRSQGIGGPQPSFVLGNIPEMEKAKLNERTTNKEEDRENIIAHDFSSSFFPFFNNWKKLYGRMFMFSIGSSVSLYVGDPDIVKALSLSKSLDIGKSNSARKNCDALLGNGIITASEHAWVTQRKIIAPEFFMDKIKGMVSVVVNSVHPLLKSWDSRIGIEGGVADIRVDKDLKIFSANVLSNTCFGNNYTEGEEIFAKVTRLHEALTIQGSMTSYPGARFLPTKRNKLLRKLAREIESLILNVVKKRNNGVEEHKDFLQTIIQKDSEVQVSDKFIIDNCKSIYFAGQESTYITAQWVLLLLAYYPDWQRRVREEVMELTLVIQETLRLYPIAPILSRQAEQEIKLGGLLIPKGTSLWIPVIHFNYDTTLWGADAHQFNPERFAKGVSSACKHPHMYMPFGLGPRTCLGQSFAMAELKIVLSMILTKYKVSPSPKYEHGVSFQLVMGPKNGVQLVVERV